MSALPPLLRLPTELRVQIFHIVAEADLNVLPSFFINSLLYEEAVLVFYQYWVPTVAIYTDTYIAYYKCPEVIKEPEVMRHGCTKDLMGSIQQTVKSFQTPHPRLNTTEEPGHYYSEQYGPDCIAKLRDTLAWLHKMPDRARKRVNRIRIPGVQTRITNYQRLIRSEQPKYGELHSLERSTDQLSENQAIEKTELQEKIWTFCRQELKNFGGFEYVYEVSPLSPWTQQLELETILSLMSSGAMAPRCMRLIFHCQLERGLYFLSTTRKHEFLQIFTRWCRQREVLQPDDRVPGLDGIDFWTSYNLQGSPYYADRSEIVSVWHRFTSLRHDILTVGFGNTMATKSFQLFRNGRMKELSKTDLSTGALEWRFDEDDEEDGVRIPA